MENQYTDIYGKVHYIKSELKRGGQGVVYKTQDPNILIKIELNEDGTEVTEPNTVYDNIRLLPIPRGINLTLPLATLKGVSGYVMYLLDDMESFDKYFSNNQNDNNELSSNNYLLNFKDNDDEVVQLFVQSMAHYISTGANKIRLEAFFKLACILARLHANGLVYGDISGNNIFISNNENNTIVWLIDSDNVNYQKITSKKIFGTPGFYAPELINPDESKRKGNTFYSDSYSFSIAFFTELLGQYPFMGDYFNQHEDEYEYEEDKEDKAFSGTLPWIFDDEDISNAAETVIPSELILTKNLREIFKRTFSKKGRECRETRPSMMEWSYFLGIEVDNTIICSSCHMGYNIKEHDQCPCCDAKNKFVSIESFVDEIKIWSFSIGINEIKLNKIPIRCVEGLRLDSVDKDIFSISFQESHLVLSCFSEDYDFYQKDGTEWILIFNGIKVLDNMTIKCSKKSETKSDCILEIKVV